MRSCIRPTPFRLSVWLLLVASLAGLPAFAADISFVLEGKVTQPNVYLAVGTPIKATYTIDTAVVSSNPAATVGDYWQPAGYGLRVAAGTFVFATDPSGAPAGGPGNFLVEIVNDHDVPPTDNYLLRSYNNLRESTDGPMPCHLSWQLDDASATAISSIAVPTEPLTLSQWTQFFGFSIEVSSVNDCESFSGREFIRGTIDTMSLVNPAQNNYVPVVTSVHPSTGPTGGGTAITLTGSNFVVDGTSVTFGSSSAASVSCSSTTRCTVISPPGIGTVSVRAMTVTGTSANVDADDFNYTAGPATTCANFSAATNFAVGTGPLSVAIGDFSGDGLSDLAVANSSSNNVSILLGTGTGTFGAAANFAAGSSPVSVAIGDLNGDGRSDLAVANSSSNNVSILLGTGAGTFGAATNFAVGTNPNSVAIGDFNGDGRSDLAVANQTSNNVSILLGTGTGTFGAATNFAVGRPLSVAIGDFNGDGRSDLAFANFGSDDVSILLGTGTGTFGAVTNFAVGTGPFSLAIGDFNGDGRSDLAVANTLSSSVSILLGTGTGTFGAAANLATGSNPRSVAIGDFNGDGQSDLAVANVGSDDTSILLGTGMGKFGAATNSAVETGPYSVAIGDFSGDGRSDLAVANSGTNNISILLNSTAPGTLALSSATYSAGEGAGTVTITVDRTAGTDCSVTVDYATANGTATSSSDYTATSGTLTFGPGVTSQTFTVPITDDTLFEGDETFTVTISNAGGGSTLGATTAVAVTVIDNDPAPSFTIDDVTEAEGNSGTTAFTFTVTKTGPTGLSATLDVATSDGTATTADADYTAVSTTLTFLPVETTKTVTVNVTGDTKFEANETFNVNLSNPTNATISNGSGIGTITNDDTAATLAIGSVTQPEGNSGTTNVVFTVTLSPASPEPVTVDYATTDGTAVAPADYVSSSGTLTFSPGTVTQTISVPVNGDTILEGDEVFSVNLTAPTNATITTATGTGTIQNDDYPPVVTSLHPSTGPMTGGTVVTITGSNFVIGGTTVTFGTNAGTSLTCSSTTRCTTTSPAGNGTVSVRVTTSSGTSADTGVDDYTYTAPATACTMLGTATNFAVGSNPRAVAIGDFNGDSRSDLAVANNVSQNLSILLGSGSGTFGAATTTPFAGGTEPSSVAIGDFNDDGRSDLAVANFRSNNVSILLGAGTGAFGAATTFAAGTGPVSVSTGDFNGDGRIDLAVANPNANSVSILLGTGRGAFGPATTSAAGPGAHSTGVGDFNDDGRSDLAVPNMGTNTVSILLSNGSATFGAATTYVVGTAPYSVAVGDFNEDGRDDLAVASGSGISILLGSGDGSFGTRKEFAAGSSPQSVAIGDFNGDGRSDLAVSNYRSDNVSILLGTGSGEFGTATNFVVGSYPYSVALGDFNGDGRSDVVVPNAFSNNVSILLNDTKPGVFLLSSASQSVNEAAGGVTITVNRTGGTDCSVTVDYATANGSAEAGSDYAASSGTITFAPGATSQTVTIPITNDTLHESDETFSVTIGNPIGGATLGGTSAIVTILDDDLVPTVTSITSSSNPSNYGAAITFSATVTDGATGNVMFNDGASTLGTAELIGNTATYTTSALSAGSHSITAAYSGDANYSGSTSAAVVQNIVDQPTIDTISPALGSATGGEWVTITGTNLATVQVVKIGTQEATVRLASATSIEIVAPRATEYEYVDVSVTTPAGTATSAGAYRIVTPGLVVNTGSGPGSLRQAIDEANSGVCEAPCTISFHFPLPAPAEGYAIEDSELSPISAPGVTIDGFANGMGTPNSNPLGTPSNAVYGVALGGTVIRDGFVLEGDSITIRGLLFRRFSHAVYVKGANARITGNQFGEVWDPDAVGFVPVQFGVTVDGARARGTVIGGPADADRNWFAPHNGGVTLTAGASEAEVLGNQFGTPFNENILDGTFARTLWGVSIDPGSNSNHIGRPGHGNLFAIMETAVYVGSNENYIQGNMFRGGSPERPLMNSRIIDMYGDAQGNLIGGSGAGEGNQFQDSGTAAVTIWQGTASSNVVVGNSFRNNAVAIDLNGDGPTANDAGDGDDGPNGMQNTPVINGAVVRGTNLTLGFSVDSSAVTKTSSLLVEVYKADAADASQGVQSLGHQCFAGNQTNASMTLPAGEVAVGDAVVALATSFSDAGCTIVNDGTSEFSAKLAVTLAPSIVASGPTEFCEGGSVTLTSSLPGSSYSWRRDGVEVSTSATYSATAPGTYTLLLTTVSGFSILTDPVPVTVFAPPIAAITQSAGATGEIILAANPGGLSYLWSTGTTGESIAVFASGTYTVQVIDGNGCSSAASATVQIAATGQTDFVDPVTGVSVSFNKLTSGSTLIVTSPATSTDPVPSGYYKFVGLDGKAVTYEISVTGSYSAPITLTFPVPWKPKDFSGFNAVKILHRENGTYVEPKPQTHHYDRQNPELSTITIQVSSLSPFAVATVRRPTLEAIIAPLEPIAVGATVSATVDFTDPDGASDVHTAVWIWGDGTTTSGAMIEPGVLGDSDGFGRVTGTHSYTTPGVYTITLEVSDNTAIGGADTTSFRYLVVYDPNGGFVTGGGWIDSPTGAYAADASLTGRATFGFVSKYANGAKVPTGQTEFNFQVASFRFKSTAYEWLVVSGPKAQYKGVGTVNGGGDYGFLLTATDGQINGGGGADKFRVKIWERATGTIVYDNVAGAPDDLTFSNPQVIGGGNIVIHK